MMLVEDRKLHGLLFGVALQPAAAIQNYCARTYSKGYVEKNSQLQLSSYSHRLILKLLIVCVYGKLTSYSYIDYYYLAPISVAGLKI